MVDTRVQPSLDAATSEPDLRLPPEPPPGWRPANWFDVFLTMPRHVAEIWEYRELLWELVLRDLKVRYKGSVLGFLWSLGNPLGMMAVFYVVFTQMMGDDRIDYFPLFCLTGLLAWNWTTGAVIGSVNAIVHNANLIKKVYFPREVLPLAAVLSSLFNFIFALPVLFAFQAFSGAPLDVDILLLPAIMALHFLFLAGLAFFLSAVNVFFRDTGVIVEVGLTAWFFLTPIFYSASQIFGTETGALVYQLNPMAGLVSFYREVIFQGGSPSSGALARVAVQAIVAFVIGYLVFLRAARRFGEEV